MVSTNALSLLIDCLKLNVCRLSKCLQGFQQILYFRILKYLRFTATHYGKQTLVLYRGLNEHQPIPSLYYHRFTLLSNNFLSFSFTTTSSFITFFPRF